VMRRRHQLDLLPLLDVFMVVLFVFATIQEQRLDDTTRDSAELERQAAEAERALRTAAARAREQEAQQAAVDQQRAAALAEAEGEADRLRRELQALRRSFVEGQEKTRVELAKAGLPQQTLERLELLARLLDEHSVFEIEIAGELGGDGKPINRCCYRDDPLLDHWRSCGVIPLRPADRELWLDEGSGGLVDALRRTKGGNAMTRVRQDSDAGHLVARSLAELLRERFPDQTIDTKVEPELTARCPE
jgi:biopolymer transport protein ExbD